GGLELTQTLAGGGVALPGDRLRPSTRRLTQPKCRFPSSRARSARWFRRRRRPNPKPRRSWSGVPSVEGEGFVADVEGEAAWSFLRSVPVVEYGPAQLVLGKYKIDRELRTGVRRRRHRVVARF